MNDLRFVYLRGSSGVRRRPVPVGGRIPAPPGQTAACRDGAALADQLQDWNQLGRYHAANEALKTQPPEPKRVVFFGDSITDIWKLAESFPGKPYVNAALAGQTHSADAGSDVPDVIDLSPRHSSAGAPTTSPAITGPETLAMIEENIQAMTELAARRCQGDSLFGDADQRLHRPEAERTASPADVLKTERVAARVCRQGPCRVRGLLLGPGGREGHV